MTLTDAEQRAVAGGFDKIEHINGLFDFCTFSPNFALRYHKGDSIVDVLICMTCKKIEFGTGDPKIRITESPADREHELFRCNENVGRICDIVITRFPEQSKRDLSRR